MAHNTIRSKEPKKKMTKGEAIVQYFLRQIRKKRLKRKNGDSYTCVGIIDTYAHELSANWDDPNTIGEYANHYFKHLLPALDEKKDAPIHEITKADYDNAIAQIAQKKLIKDGIPYADSTINHFKYLFRILVKVAYKHHHCRDCFWASDYDPAPFSEEELKERFLPKSLTATQFARIIYPLTVSPETMPGAWAGLLIMASCDFRDNEACAVKYEEICPRDGIDCIWVIKTVHAKSPSVKDGGKTPNSERGFPLPQKTHEAIMKRKRYIIEYINSHYDEVISSHEEFKGLSADDIVNRLPIVCRKDNYFSGVSSAELSDAGRDFFRFIGFDQKEFYLADRASSSDLIVNAGFDLKNPSSYLLRRDCCTVMRILGLREEYILELMGHKIENSYLTRNDLLNELRQMKCRLDQRPVLNSQPKNEINLSSSNRILPSNYDIMPNDSLNITTRPGEEMFIILTAQEPGDTFSVKVKNKKNEEISVPVNNSYITDVYTGPVNVIKQFQADFEKAYNRVKRSKNPPHPSKYLTESAST